ncbi:MAG: hypothetical protein BGO98_39340 [Myxococcales bacterium 68-20]|nr:MAG: hypothetical protein BGO98_39340 [Myxococcales bacterium 68-20]
MSYDAPSMLSSAGRPPRSTARRALAAPFERDRQKSSKSIPTTSSPTTSKPAVFACRAIPVFMFTGNT